MMIVALILFSLTLNLSAVNTPPQARRPIINYSNNLIRAFENNTGNDLYHTYPPEADPIAQKYGEYSEETKNGRETGNNQYRIPGSIRSADTQQSKFVMARLLKNSAGIIFHRELKKVKYNALLDDPIYPAYKTAMEHIENPPLSPNTSQNTSINWRKNKNEYVEKEHAVFFRPDPNNKRMQLVLYKPSRASQQLRYQGGN
jgi:hypothetical protein